MIEFAYKPHWLWLLLGGLVTAGFLYWSFRRARGATGAWRRVVILMLRCLTVAVVVACILDPRRIQPAQRSEPSQLAVLLDTSLSMGTREGAQSRLELARAWLGRNLATNSIVNWFGFSDELRRVDGPAALTNAAGTTELGMALDGLLALEPAASGIRPLGAVLLLSDGRDNGGLDPLAVVRKYYQRKVLLHTLVVGSTNEIPDIRIEEVQVQHRVAEQAPAALKAVLRSPGFKGATVPLRLLQGTRLMAETNVVLSGAEQSVEMALVSPRRGFQVFTLEIPPQPGERLTANNRRQFGCEVVDPSLRVLYMEGTGDVGSGPECLYLHRSLSREPGVKIKTLYRNQSVESQHDSALRRIPRRADRRSRLPGRKPQRGLSQVPGGPAAI